MKRTFTFLLTLMASAGIICLLLGALLGELLFLLIAPEELFKLPGVEEALPNVPVLPPAPLPEDSSRFTIAVGACSKRLILLRYPWGKCFS